jgi:hypothetical protein
MMRSRASLVLALAVVASGCATGNGPYVFAAGERTARLRVVDSQKFSICKDSRFYDVTPDPGTPYARIPASGRITVGRFLYYQGYQVHYSCYPMLSFDPRPDGEYVMDAGVTGDRCFIDLVRADGASPTGIAPERSVGPRDCYERKTTPPAPARAAPEGTEPEA